MNAIIFKENLHKAFGNIELPLAFWYSSTAVPAPEKTKGCFIKELKNAREGTHLTLNADTISCRGGKVYTGFTEFTHPIAEFVAGKEKYKSSPEQVCQFVSELNLLAAPAPYLHFARIDTLDSLDDIEGVIFFANPDILTGLVAWTLFDTNRPDAVSVPFGSGCSSIVAQIMTENRENGKRTFIGLFDPSVRPNVEPDILSFAIPLSRLTEMYETLSSCCLSDTPAWSKVRKRINNE